ncbi:5'-methylthioadenosine/S-adenosylhomocysteine nucleosidase [Hymenobacter sp. BRD67]|uniref:5'-methylthioadenosine/S-adenosylhomocysteine nucleosidase family protein n=1 Tax=Hymenobacter sp. BRD67 TaxID=2675877 RepID=UPI0015637C82|nr:5'-methylthioadenosine/S-adenosylhomocysteine nucleosidase [Hymenobacter sp. BRD67]QKG51825.1 5'-methylthioadenosine/S-adenosylhomocysteine nucleosidase [Hymenobacter sp. BRD67]
MKSDILVITALALEFKAVERLLINPEPIRHPTGARYSRGTFTAGQHAFSVAIVETGAGNVNAAQETERALPFFQPEYVFFVGIGGGMKDVAIGDIVISSEVIHYEGGKAGDVYKPRLSIYPANYELMALAKLIARDASWQHRIDDGLGTFKAEVKPIAAGEKVVASERSLTYELLNQSVSQALAVEMEGYGFLAPIHAHHKKGIVIRGISDLLKNKEAADASGSQPLAARNAAAFLAEMLAELAEESIQARNTVHTVDIPAISQVATMPLSTKLLDNAEWRHQLAKTLAGLYEVGPTESAGAWKRAGGKVGFLSSSSSIEAQWFTAIERLAQGGAGDITLSSLLQMAREDFRGNSKVQILCKDIGLD